MPQSRDRVKFKFTDCDSNKRAAMDAAMRAFKLKHHEADKLWFNCAEITCRPSQFARFLIYRSEGVSNNGFRQFKAKLVEQECEGRLTKLDVSQRFHTECD